MGASFAVWSLVASVALAQPDAGTTEPQARPVPARFQSEVEQAVRVGREIFAQDEVSARATDVYMEALPAARRAAFRGWITVEGPWWKVVFVVDEGGTERAGFEVSFPRDERPEQARPTVKLHDPPRALEPDELSRRAALKTVLQSRSGTCGRPMNPVVLPGSVARRRGWLVYLLNPTNDAAVIVSGGHTRFLVSEDGTTLLETTRLSQCLSQRRAPAPGAETVETFIVTPLFDAPNEGHVFTAMSNRLPLLLATMRSTPMTTWKIRPDGVIEYLGEHRRPAADAGP